MSLKKKAANSALWAAIADWTSLALSLAVFLVLARLLEPADFGLIALAGVYIAFVQIFVDPGISQALIQREHIEPGHLNMAFWANTAFSLMLILGTFLFAPAWAEIFEEPELVDVTRVMSLAFLLFALSSTQQTILTRDFRFKSLGIRKVTATACGGFSGIWAAIEGFGVWSLVVQQLVTGVSSLIVLWWASPWRPTRAFSRRHVIEIYGFGMHVLSIKLLSFINTQSDKLLIGYFLGATSLGYYTIGRRIFQIAIDILVNAPSKIALPTFSRMQSRPEELRLAHARAVRLTTFITFPAFSALIVSAPLLIELVFGAKWEASAPILQFLSVAGLFAGIGYFTVPALLSVGKARTASLLSAINSLSNLVAFTLAVNWGIVAVSAAFSIRAVLMQPIGLYTLKKQFGIRIAKLYSKLMGTIVASLFSSGVMLVSMATMTGADAPAYLVFLTSSAAFTISYLGLQYLANRRLVTEIVDLFMLAIKR